MIRRFASRAALPFVLLLAVLVSAPRLYAAPTTTLLGANINPSALGQQVSFTATVTAVSGTPTGTVEFADNGTIIGAAALDSAGVATFLTAVLAAGSHAITAVYSGASGFDPSSSSMTQVVNPRPTAMTVSVSAMPVGVRVQSDVHVLVSDAATTGPAGSPGAFVSSPHIMAGRRSGHSATLLREGTVLIAGGAAGSNVTRDADLYSPASGFTSVGHMHTARRNHTATLLPNGKVLIVGGSGTGNSVLETAEIFDPADGSFTVSAAMLDPPRTGHTATLLPSDKVLIAGGYDSDGQALLGTSLYDPALDSFAAGPGPLLVARAGHTATLLRNGTILFAGGHTSSAERYDPATAVSEFTDNLNASRAGHAAALLPDGNVLLTGGAVSGTPVTGSELFDSAAGTFTPAGIMNFARAGHTATLLNSALVLLSGGTDGDNNPLELYTPSFDPQGAVALASDHAFDTFGGECLLTLTGTGGSSCHTGVRPLQIGTGTHRITGAYPGGANHMSSTDYDGLSVVVATPTIAVENTHPEYDGAPHSAIARALAADGYQVAGAFVVTYDGSATLPTHAGTYAVAVAFTSSDLNFNSTSGTGTFTIAPRPVTVSADPKTKVYGDPEPALTYQVSGGSLVTGDVFTGGVGRTAGEDVGEYPVGQGTLALSSDYLLTYLAAPLTITARPITVVALAKSKVYGAPDPVFDYSVTAGALQFTDAFTGALTREHGESIGTYAIRRGTLALSSNYALTYIGADLTVGPAGTRSQLRTRFTASGLTLTLKATVAPQISGVPTGHVIFTDSVGGAFPGGTKTLMGGEAELAFSLPQLAPGAHSLTAPYDLSDPNFAGAALTVPAALLVLPAIGATSGQSIPDIALTITNPTAETVTLTNLGCQVEVTAGSVPADLRPACALRSLPTTLPPGTTSITLTIGTSAGNSAHSSVSAASSIRSPYMGLLGLPAVAILGFALSSGRPRRQAHRQLLLAGGLLLMLAVLAMAGCGGGFSNAGNLQPSTEGGTQPGSYMVVVRYTDGEANAVPLATVLLNVSY